MKISWKRLSVAEPDRLTSGGSRHDMPRRVPGRPFLIHRIRGDSGSGLVLTDTRGRLVHPLVLGPGEYGAAAPLPEGTMALYSYRESAQDSWRIRSLRIPEGVAEGKDLDLEGAGVNLLDPAPHPDGTRFVFASDESSPGTTHLWEATPGRQQKRPLTTSAERADDQPALSPSGRFVAFRGRTGEGADLYLLDLETLEIRRLTAAPGECGEPSFLDEYRIVFSRTLPSGDRGLLVLDTLRGREKWITGVLERPHQPCVSVSRKGRVRLYFARGRGDTSDVYRTRLEGVRGRP